MAGIAAKAKSKVPARELPDNWKACDEGSFLYRDRIVAAVIQDVASERVWEPSTSPSALLGRILIAMSLRFPPKNRSPSSAAFDRCDCLAKLSNI